MDTPLLQTKLYLPRTRADPVTKLGTSLVPRPHLIERLNEGLSGKLTLISAGAGFGKTTVLSDWLAQIKRPAAWLSLDEEDNDLTRFLTYLVAALQTIQPAVGAEVLALLQSSPLPRSHTLLTLLINDLTALSAEFILVLDDYHVIETDTIDQALTFFIDHMPPTMHLVMTSRVDPNLPLARLRASGQLHELRSADLRFTLTETGQFLEQMAGLGLAPPEVAALDRHTEGWIAGLQMAALSLMFEELVSHGYVVAAIDQPYASTGVLFPDGRLVTLDARLFPGPTGGLPADRKFFDNVVIPYLAKDVSFTLDQLTGLNQADPNRVLTGRLDLARAGIFGPSLGGLVGAEACYMDPRLKVLLAMDVHMPSDAVRAGLKQPTMFITRDAKWMRLEGWNQAYIDELQTSIQAVYERLPGDGYLVLAPGMFHNNFSDAALYSPLMSWLGLTGPIDGERANSIIGAYTLAFFDKHLKGQPAALLDGLAEQYPEVFFETRRP